MVKLQYQFYGGMDHYSKASKQSGQGGNSR